MSVTVVINNQTFQYPVAGTEPGWGQDAELAFVALVDVVNSLQSPNDILLTQFNIPDNATSPATINGLSFDSSVRAAEVFYSIYRISTDSPFGHTETGKLLLTLDSSAPSGSKWLMTQQADGNAGVSFSVADSGQISFISSQIDMGGGGYSGIIKFSAKTIGV